MSGIAVMTPTPQMAIAIIQKVKKADDADLILVGRTEGGKVVTFYLARENEDSVLQSEMLIANHHLHSKRYKLRDLPIVVLKEILELSNIDTTQVIPKVSNKEGIKVTLDVGTMYEDSQGSVYQIRNTEDKRSLLDVINGNDEKGIIVNFANACKSLKPSKLKKSITLNEMYQMIKNKELSLIF